MEYLQQTAKLLLNFMHYSKHNSSLNTLEIQSQTDLTYYVDTKFKGDLKPHI